METLPNSSFGIITTLIERRGSFALEAWNVREDVEKLMRSMTQIKSVIYDAGERQKTAYSHELNTWLETLYDALHEAEDLFDEVATEDLIRKVMTENKNAKKVCIFFSKSNQIAFKFKMASKVKKMAKMFDDLNVGKRVFNFSTQYPNQLIMNQRITVPLISEQHVIGREDMKNRLIRLLLKTEVETDVSAIIIVGVGGLGKTALAQVLFSDPRVQNHFECKKWVCVADNISGFDAKSIATKMAGCNTNDDTQLVRQKLKQQMDGLRSLIVLDDVWSEACRGWDQFMEMEMLVKVARGSKIIITTRTKAVAKVSRASSIIYLSSLNEEQSWNLFSQHAFGAIGKEPQNQNLIPIGKDIVKKCAGVPLAIKVIGELMA